MKAIRIFLLLFVPFVGFSQVPASHTVYASDYMIFSPSDLTILQNDTVFFENLTNHNAVEVSQETYQNNGILSNGGFQLYSDNYLVFDEVGTHYYVCTPHVQMGMKGIINVQALPSLVGQWYVDIGDYLEVTADSFFVYIFEDDCYILDAFSYQLNDSILTLNDEGEQMTLSVFDITQESALIILNGDSVNATDTTFDASLWTPCDDEYSWNCLESSCVEMSDFSGEFSTLEDCQSICGESITTYECIEMYSPQEGYYLGCSELSDGMGIYNSLEECETFCNQNNTSYNCIDLSCVELSDDTGVYASLSECQDECQNSTSIIENDGKVQVFPNPSSAVFKIEFYSENETEISVTNILGKQVYLQRTHSFGQFNDLIDLSEQAKGIYNLTITSSNRISKRKLILQ